MTRLLNRAIRVHHQEVPALLWSFGYMQAGYGRLPSKEERQRMLAYFEEL